MSEPANHNPSARATFLAALDARLRSLSYQTQPSHDGLRVPLYGGPLHPTVYVQVLPWARGWAIYATEDPNAAVYEHSEQPARYKGLQRPVYVRRGGGGPENASVSDILAAVEYIAERITRLAAARTMRFNKKVWYWPRSALASLPNYVTVPPIDRRTDKHEVPSS